ncbi:hypothetical protein D3C87_1119740 [compost metagenome]
MDNTILNKRLKEHFRYGISLWDSFQIVFYCKNTKVPLLHNMQIALQPSKVIFKRYRLLLSLDRIMKHRR